MSIQKIIQESINNKPLEMKEAFAEELRNRVAEALAAKMEEVEQIDEISKATLGSYIKKAGGTSLNSAGAHMADYGANRNPKSFKKGINRAKGVMRAADRLTKEEAEQLDEGLDFQNKTSRSGASTTHIYHNGKHLGTIAKHFTKSNPNGSYRIQYNSDTIPAGSKGLHAHEGLPSQDAAKKLVSKHVNESVEQIDELDRKTLHNYLTKSSSDLKAINTARKITANDKSSEDVKHHADLTRKAGNRKKGFSRAYDRLTKEEVELDEAWSDGVSSRNAHMHARAAAQYRKKANDSASIAKTYEKGSSEHNKHMAAYHSAMAKSIKSSYHAGQYGSVSTAKKDHKAEMDKAKQYKSTNESFDLDEAVEVRHDRYMRSHGKKASGTGGWFFTHKSGAVNNLDDKKEVHFHQGKFSDAAKSAKAWAKEHGHNTVYVMEEVEIDESFGAAIKKAEASRQRALKKAASMVKRGFSHEEAAKNHDVKVADLKKHMGESVNLEEGISPQDYSTHGVKSQFGGYRAHIKHKTKGHTMYTGSHGYDTPNKAKGEAEAYLKGYAEYGDMTANKNAQAYARQHAISGPYAKKQANEEVEALDELKKSTLGSYIKKAAERLPKHQRDASAAAQVNSIDDYKKSAKMRDNRKLGIQRAADRLTKE